MALICKDICRDCLPPQEYFEYGLWMPADKYREETDASSVASSDGDLDPAAKKAAAEAKAAEAAAAAEAKRRAEEAESKVSQTFKQNMGGKTTATAAEAANIVRKCGLAPSLRDIEDFKARKGDSVTSKDVEEWTKELAAVQADDTLNNLVGFFRYYDEKNTGTLSKRQMSNILKNFGEPLTDDEINGIFTTMGATGDQIDYVKFVEGMLSTKE